MCCLNNLGTMPLNRRMELWNENDAPFPWQHNSSTEKGGMRESFRRQVDKKSRGPQGERGLGYSRRKKGQNSFPLLSLGLYNNDVSCLRTVSGLNLLANSVILKCKLWE